MLLQFFTSLDFSDQQDLIYSPSLFKQAFRKKSTCHRLILLCDYLIYNFWTLTLYIFYYSTRITCCNAISWNTLGNDTATTYHSTRTNNYPFQNNTTSPSIWQYGWKPHVQRVPMSTSSSIMIGAVAAAKPSTLYPCSFFSIDLRILKLRLCASVSIIIQSPPIFT